MRRNRYARRAAPPNKALQLTSAEHIERSQLNAGVRRTSRGAMRRTGYLLVAASAALSCATGHTYARRLESDRSAQVFFSAVRLGMSLPEVVRAMTDSRLPYQVASMSAVAGSGDTVRIVLHAGEPLASVGKTRVFAGGFASLEVYHRSNAHLASYGFERAGPLLDAVQTRQAELVAYRSFVVAFEARVEGGCGESTVPLTFDRAGHLSELGKLEERDCAS